MLSLGLAWLKRGEIELESIEIVAWTISSSKSCLSSAVVVRHRQHLHEYCAGKWVDRAELITSYSGRTDPSMLGSTGIVRRPYQLTGCSLVYCIDTMERMERMACIVAKS